MQEVCLCPGVILPLIILIALPAIGLVGYAGQLQVATAAVCRQVVNRKPIDAGTNFPLSGKLSCFAKVIGVEGPAKITHVWYSDDNDRFRIDLAVNGLTWQVFSAKAIRAGETGSWRVDILDSARTMLKAVPFEVTLESVGDTVQGEAVRREAEKG